MRDSGYCRFLDKAVEYVSCGLTCRAHVDLDKSLIWGARHFTIWIGLYAACLDLGSLDDRYLPRRREDAQLVVHVGGLRISRRCGDKQ